MKPFQVGVLVVFAALALLAVFVFASFSSNNQDAVGKVTIWGTLPAETFDKLLSAVTSSSNGFEGVSYKEISQASFTNTLVEAIAADRGPDLILFSSDSVLKDSDKIVPISYRTVSRRSFQDTFIEAGEVFLTDNGVLGLPFYIDPYVMFWNRTLFSEAGIARTPRYWDEFTDIAPRLSRGIQNGTLTQSAVALGEWGNIVHAKDIFISLIVGLGNPIISLDGNGEPHAVLTTRGELAASPAESALRFYTDFADPVKNVYSWNRSLAPSRDAFLAGSLAVYLGQASEVFELRSSNPNLNFDVAAYPSVRDGRTAVPAKLYALAIPRGSKNPTGAAQTALLFSGVDVQQTLVSATGLPSVRRDILSVSPENPYESLFRNAALNAYTFYDPSPELTEGIFKRMVDDVSSGKLRIPEAIISGQAELLALPGVQ